MQRAEDLSLYRYDGCMWCGLVERNLAELGVELALRDVRVDPSNLRDLVDATGRQTVPCLRIAEPGGDRWMHESSVIIAYLQDRFATP